MTFVVTAANRLKSLNYMLKACSPAADLTSADNALICGTTCISTGVTLPGINCCILANCSSVEDLAQRAGRVARVAGTMGLVYVLYSTQELARLDGSRRGALQQVLTSKDCIPVTLASCFLVPNAGPPLATCMESETLMTAPCSSCEPAHVDKLRAEFKASKIDGRDIMPFWTDAVIDADDEADHGPLPVEQQTIEAFQRDFHEGLFQCLQPLLDQGELPEALVRVWPDVEKALNHELG